MVLIDKVPEYETPYRVDSSAHDSSELGPPPVSSPSTNKLLPTLSGLGLILLMVGLLFYTPCPSDAQFFTFRVVLALAAGAFAALIPGFLNVRWNTPSIQAGGGLALFALIYFLNPAQGIATDSCNPTRDLTLFIENAQGQAVLQSGTISYRIGNNRSQESINTEGEVTLKQLPQKDSLYLELLALGWQFTHGKKTQTIWPGGRDQVVLQIERDNSLCCLKGFVQDETGNRLEGVQIIVGDTALRTNALGNFELKLPKSKQREHYKIQAQKEGYENWSLTIDPRKEEELEILLEQKP